MIDIFEILKSLPHRYPFLMVDRVIEMEEGKRVVAIKNVTINEPFFQGHFPGHPIMPGVLICEALAQAGALLAIRSSGFDAQKHVIYFMALDAVKFRRPVRPGDQLRLEVEALRARGRIWKMRGVARVDGEVACEAEFLATVANRDRDAPATT